MLKKAREAAADNEAAEGKDDTKPAMDSSRSIWLAGLGAFSRAQAEGMRMFEALVQAGRGARVQDARRRPSDTAAAARGAAKAKAKEVKDGVGGTWDKLEQVFEERVGAGAVASSACTRKATSSACRSASTRCPKR